MFFSQRGLAVAARGRQTRPRPGDSGEVRRRGAGISSGLEDGAATRPSAAIGFRCLGGERRCVKVKGLERWNMAASNAVLHRGFIQGWAAQTQILTAQIHRASENRRVTSSPV